MVNDFLFIMKYLEDKIYIEKSRFNLIKLRKERDIENAINKIKKQNLNSTDEVIKKLRYRLDKLKYYKEIATKLDIDLPISQQIHKVYLDYTNEYVRGYKALEIEIENLLEIIKDYNSFKIKNNTKDKIESIIDKYNFEYQEDIDRVEDAILYWQKKVNYLQISSLKHNKILNNLIPINTNNSIKIEKISQYNILRVSIISLILGFFAGIISVLFRYSVRNY